MTTTTTNNTRIQWGDNAGDELDSEKKRLKKSNFQDYLMVHINNNNNNAFCF